MRRRIELAYVAYLCVRALLAVRSSWRDLAYLAYIARPERRDPRAEGWAW